LRRPGQVEHLLAGADHRAVDEPGDHRGDAAGGDRDHDLVEERDALGSASERDQCPALAEVGQGGQIRVVEPFAQTPGLGEEGVGLGRPGAEEVLHRLREEQQSAFDAVGRLGVQEALPAGLPPAGLRHLAGDLQLEPGPERCPDRAWVVAAFLRQLEDPGPQADALLLVADQVRRDGVAIEVINVEPGVLIRLEEAVAGRRPLAAGESRPGDVERPRS
jgi:hypothetical protein